MTTIKDLKQIAQGVSAYGLTLPDGRTVHVGKIPVNKIDVRRSFVWQSTEWACHIIDREADVARIQEGYQTRKAAFDAAIDWATANPRGSVKVEAA